MSYFRARQTHKARAKGQCGTACRDLTAGFLLVKHHPDQWLHRSREGRGRKNKGLKEWSVKPVIVTS
jgi:hypothetical protein